MTLYLVSYWLTVWLLPCKAVNSRHRVETHAGPRSFFLSLFSIKRIVCKLDKQYLLKLSTCTSDCPWNNIWTAGEMIFSSLFVSEPCEHQTWSFRVKDNFVQGWRNHWHHNLTIKYKEYTKGSLGFLLRKHPDWRYQKMIYHIWIIIYIWRVFWVLSYHNHTFQKFDHCKLYVISPCKENKTSTFSCWQQFDASFQMLYRCRQADLGDLSGKVISISFLFFLEKLTGRTLSQLALKLVVRP